MIVRMLAALPSALVADFGAKLTEFHNKGARMLAGSRHKRCGHPAHIRAAPIEFNAPPHPFHIGFAQTCGCAMFALRSAMVTGGDAALEFIMTHGKQIK
jgi:hypothetical protein